MFKLFFQVLILTTVLSSCLHAQQQQEINSLWQTVSQQQREGKLDEAIGSLDKIIALLEPNAEMLNSGIQLAPAYRLKAALYFSSESYKESEQVLLKGLAQAKRIKPPEGLPAQSVKLMMGIVNDQVRSCARALADYYLTFGDLKKATKYFESAQAIKPNWQIQSELNPSLTHLILASDVSSMDGNFYRQTGNYAAAIEAYTKMLDRYETAWKKVETQYGKIESMAAMRQGFRMNYLTGKSSFLIELAEISSLQGLHKPAIGFARQARDAVTELVKIYKGWTAENLKSGAIPKESVQATYDSVVANANYLVFERCARVFRAAGEEQTALELVTEGIRRFDKDLHRMRYLSSEYNVARPEESYQLLGDLQVLLGKKEDAQKSYEKALEIIDGVYGEGHPSRLAIQASIAMLHALSNRADEAKKIALKNRELQSRNLAIVLQFASEPQRLAYRNSVDSWSLLASLRLDKEVALSVFRTKAIVLDSLLSDQQLMAAAKSSQQQMTLLELQKLRRKFMEVTLAGKSETSVETSAIRAQIQELEQKLSSKSGNVLIKAATTVTIKQVSDVLPKGAAIVEFIRYRRFAGPGRFVEHYGAVLLKSGSLEPVFQPLESAEKIESALVAYGKAVRGKPTDEQMANLLRALTKLVWEPLETHLPDKGSRLILAPDAELNFLSFAGLLDREGKFIAESYFLSYVSTARDLLRGVKPSTSNEMVILANPDYGEPNLPDPKKKPSKPATGQAQKQESTNDGRGQIETGMKGYLSSINFKPLAGTGVEAKVLNEIVKKKWGWDVETYLDKAATEAVVNSVRSPRILHLATHGFYLSRAGKLDPLIRARNYWDPSAPKLDTNSVRSFCSNIVLDNPMHRSGIALAKANETLKVWGEGKVPDTSNDGMLTATEVSLLNLNSTWLVVLSACETGLGQANSGEGVLGLRRALIQAGSQNVLVTLWPIADRETVYFMDIFYSNLTEGKKDPALIAHLTQLKFLREFRKEKGLTQAIKLAAPFVLNFQR